MGTVYRAEQSHPVKRRVALKLIRTGMDSRKVAARFDAERQALALMDHPNIARVYDGGATEDHRPFFVMELVDGVPITAYCDQRRLTVQARLELFVAVCQAVQHAHQKGIIHRDLKPGNVLVTEVDGRPTPKVIDFGVAKAVEFDLTDRSLGDTGAIVGTPTYMSPEQADPSSMDIDTRTDVYALGVILYELLAGSPPIDANQFKRGALIEMLRMVREVEPPRPSHKLSTSDALPGIAAVRNVDPDRLKRSLRGDLDWIVMKALEKDRARRYDTANGFGADIQRHLTSEPVLAAPPGRIYRMRKFVRKHRVPVIAASLVLLALVVGVVGTSVGMYQAYQAQRRAETAEAATETKAEELAHHLDNSNFLLASAAYDNRDMVGARALLDRIRDKNRGWEWWYLRRQSIGGIFTLYGHTSAVTSVSYSPDGTRIVTGSMDKTAKVWDARTGTQLLDLTGHTEGVTSVSCSPDGTRIVTGGVCGTAKVWDARTGTPLLDLKRGAVTVASVSFSPDGTRIVTGNVDWTAKVWDARTSTLVFDLERHTGVVTGVSFSPDGTRIVTGSGDGTAKVWDARTGTLLLDLKGHRFSVEGVSFSPDGARIVTGSSDGTTKVWDARTGTPLLDLKGHTDDGVESVSYSPDGTRIVTAIADTGWGGGAGVAKVWDARTGTPLLELKGHTDGVSSASFSPDGTRVVTGSWDGTAKVWDARTGVPLLDLEGHTDGVESVLHSSDGTWIVTGSRDKTAKVWDAETGTPLLDLKGHTSVVTSASFSPDGMWIVTGSDDKTARIWDARTGMTLLDLKGHTDGISSVSFNSDGTRIVTGSRDKTAKVWDARTGTPLLDLKGHTGKVTSASFSPDGTRIVTGSDDKTVKVWDARTGTLRFDLMGHTDGVSSVSFSLDGERILTGSNETAKIWDAETGTPLLDLKGHTGWVTGVSFDSDGMRIVTGGYDNTAKVWDARTGLAIVGEPVPSVPGPSPISPDGRWIVRSVRDHGELNLLQPDEEELAYRRIHARPNLRRYREGYGAARKVGDDFAARFYLHLLPPAERKVLEAEAAADREIAAGRTREALAHLVTASVGKPDDTRFAVKLAALQMWFGRDKDHVDTCGRALEFAWSTFDPDQWSDAARICLLQPSQDKSRLEAALALVRKSVEAEECYGNQLLLGLAEYRNGHFVEADATLIAIVKKDECDSYTIGVLTFYRAMIQFLQGKKDEARKLATEAAAEMKPLPRDEKNPLADGATTDDLILWLAYKEARELIKFDAAPAAPAKPAAK